MPAAAAPGGDACSASFRLDGETFRCALPVEHVYLDSSDHQCSVQWADEIVGRRHRPHLAAVE